MGYTIGQHQLRTTNKIFMKNTKIALIVYDITYENSFKNLNNFYNEMYVKKENIVIGVVANKSDLYDNQVVSKEEGEEYAKSINVLFFETTATEHECIENLFNNVVNYYDEQKNPNIEDHLESSFILTKNKNVNNNNTMIKEMMIIIIIPLINEKIQLMKKKSVVKNCFIIFFFNKDIKIIFNNFDFLSLN